MFIIKQCPLVLVVGTGLESFPLESLPILRHCAVSRMPSLEFVFRYDQEEHKRLVDPSKGYYILNPSSDLTSTQVSTVSFSLCFSSTTQARFEAEFKDKGWRGLAGVTPSAQHFREALTEYDLFVYCGHNAGQQYLRMEHQQLRVSPVSLLMGCSSAALRSLAPYDSSGPVLSYLSQRCPAVLGNLWDVTDGDLDRYLKNLLDDWLAPSDFLCSAASARDTCKLSYLVGAAPVTYGLPIVQLQSKE